MKHTHGPRARRPGRSRAGVRADTLGRASTPFERDRSRPRPPEPWPQALAASACASPRARACSPWPWPQPREPLSARGRPERPRGAPLLVASLPLLRLVAFEGGTEGTQGIMSPRCEERVSFLASAPAGSGSQIQHGQECFPLGAS